MKTRLLLVAAGLLALLSPGAQAQVTLDGTLGAGEAGQATAGKYISLGQYPYAHGFEEGMPYAPAAWPPAPPCCACRWATT